MKDLDYLVYGATGFVGQRVARLLRRHAAGAKIGIAGRSAARLEPVAAEAGDVEVVLADSAEPSSVREAVRRARVVLACAGPFARYGTPVVDACVEERAHYVDITGETPWVRGLIERHHRRARDEGTFIIPFSGYDSIPSDLTTWLAVRALRDQHGVAARRAVVLQRGKGGVNGGTLASAFELFGDDEKRRVFFDPFSLVPDLPAPTKEPRPRDASGRGAFRPRKDLDGVPRLPFMMGGINGAVVRRSAALFAEQGAPYGEGFSYDELMDLGQKSAGMKARVGHVVLGTSMALMRAGPTRSALARLVPGPGTGPSEEVVEGGFARTRTTVEGEGGARATVTLQASGDPGNAVTAALIVAAARSLGEDGPALGVGQAGRGGLLTPAFALGDVLADKLRGMDISVDVGG